MTFDLGDSNEWLFYKSRTLIEEKQSYDAVFRARIVASDIDNPAPSKERTTRKRHWAVTEQSRVNRWLKGERNEKLERRLGYSRDDLRSHLERQFARGMCWENYAGHLSYMTQQKSWVIDHIVPKRLFEVCDVRAAFALSNLRPFWMDDNIRKANKRTHLI